MLLLSCKKKTENKLTIRIKTKWGGGQDHREEGINSKEQISEMTNKIELLTRLIKKQKTRI